MSAKSQYCLFCDAWHTDGTPCLAVRAASSFDPARGSGEADPLVSELRKLAATDYPLCREARLLLEMAVEAQLGKPLDVTRLLPNDQSSPTGRKPSKGNP